MAIVKMKKLHMVGLDTIRPNLMNELMELGLVEITPQDHKLTDEQWSDFVLKGGDENKIGELDAKVQRALLAVDIITKYDTAKKPLFATRKIITQTAFNNVIADREGVKAKVRETVALLERLNEQKNHKNKVEATILSLNPWIKYSIGLEVEKTPCVNIMIGVLPVNANVPSVVEQTLKKTDKVEITLLNSDAEQHYLSVICKTEEKDLVVDELKSFGFNQVYFKDMVGTPAENIEKCKAMVAELEKGIADIEGKITKMSEFKEEIKFYADQLTIERDKEKILSRMVKTKNTFYLEGWFPQAVEDKVVAIAKANGCYYEVKMPEKDEKFPVALSASPAVFPFQAITNLYSLPDSGGIDPTPFFSFFYFLFFGLMLSDAGYGIVMTVVCYILLKKFNLENMTQKLIKMFYYCGISTTFWGALFGGWFGDIATVAAEVFFGIKGFVIKPLWFNPVDDPMKLLIFSFIVGGIHLFLGMGLKAYMLIREGKWVDAICDVGFWYLLLAGLPMFGIGSLLNIPQLSIGGPIAASGALGLLLTGGRSKKGLFPKLIGGLGSLYNITGYLSDILSYSRLLALGLATGVIATVINTMGSLMGGGIVGSIVLVVVFIFGHTFNLAINALGSFVHSSRLQYVEFFSKFYESGGIAFAPFKKQTKYVDIIKEEN